MWLQEYEVVKARAVYANSQALMIKIGMWPAFIPLRDVAGASPEHYVTQEVGRGCPPHNASLGPGSFVHHLGVTRASPTLDLQKMCNRVAAWRLVCRKASSFVCGGLPILGKLLGLLRSRCHQKGGKSWQGLNWWHGEAFLR